MAASSCMWSVTQLDVFRALPVCMDRSDTSFLAAFRFAFALLNFRHLFAQLP